MDAIEQKCGGFMKTGQLILSGFLATGFVVFSSQALAKKKLDVSAFNDIISENQKAEKELRERIADYAGVIRDNPEIRPNLAKDLQLRNQAAEQVAVSGSSYISSGDSDFRAERRTDNQRISQEVREALAQ
jgi:uncharacterized protein YllA (UPF0747 family)